MFHIKISAWLNTSEDPKINTILTISNCNILNLFRTPQDTLSEGKSNYVEEKIFGWQPKGATWRENAVNAIRS